MQQAWHLAQEWYADRLEADWRRKTAEEIREIFGRVGLTSEFWRV